MYCDAGLTVWFKGDKSLLKQFIDIIMVQAFPATILSNLLIVIITLDLRRCEIPCPAKCLCGLSSGSEFIIDCSSQKLVKFEQVKLAQNLEIARLNLSYNHISIDKVQVFKSLKILDLSHNNIVNIPKYLKNFLNLEVLNLSHNAIQTIPNNLPPKLKILKLSYNSIKIVDLPILTSLLNLQALYLDFNMISNIESSTRNSKFPKLEILNLKSNKLESLSSNFWELLENVKKLSLCNNSLDFISEDTFVKFANLNYVDLSYNKLQDIAADMFVRNTNLKFLIVSNNLLEKIPKGLPMLEYLDLSYNQIHQISEDYSNDLYPQEIFLIGGNPYHCDCDLLWLKEYYHTREFLKMIVNIDPLKFIPVCASPGELAGKSWEVLDDALFGCDVNYVDSASKSQEFLEGSSEVPSWRISDLFIKISEVGDTYIHIVWNSLAVKSDRSKNVIFFSIHPFGKKHLQRKAMLEIRLGKYVVRNLNPDTQYLLCIGIIPPNAISADISLNNCHEIVSMETPFCYSVQSVISYSLLFIFSFVIVYYFSIWAFNLKILFNFVKFLQKDSVQLTKNGYAITPKSILKKNKT